MAIILNENEWAEGMLRERTLGTKPFETLTRVGRYYIDHGYSKEKTRVLLESFLIQCDPSLSVVKWEKQIEFALNKALKNEAIEITGIDITRSELTVIDALDGVQLKRLAFTLLCLSKYWNVANKSKDNWVNSKDSDIMRMANINTSIKRQSLMYHTLNECGLIQFSKKVNNTNVKVMFADDNDTVAVRISDFRNLGNQYMMLTSGQYIKCANCGLVVRKTNVTDSLYKADNSKQKYCKKCAAELRIRRNVGRIMEFNKE